MQLEYASATKISSLCENNHLKANPGNSNTLLRGKKQKVISTDRIPLTADSHEKLLRFKAALSWMRQFLATENPLKMMKNAFYFTSKALFILSSFCLDLLVMHRSDLIRKTG